MQKPNVLTTTILNAASLSAALPLGDGFPTRLVMPDTWTAASLTFQTSYDGTTFNNLHNADGTEYTVTAAQQREIVLVPADFIGVRFLKIRSGTNGTPVAQGGDRTLRVVVQG